MKRNQNIVFRGIGKASSLAAALPLLLGACSQDAKGERVDGPSPGASAGVVSSREWPAEVGSPEASRAMTLAKDDLTSSGMSGANQLAVMGADNAVEGELRSAPGKRLRSEEYEDYDGGRWGKSYEKAFGDVCSPGYKRSSAEAWRSNGHHGHCEVERWFSNDEHDCRVFVHIGVSSFRSGTCTIQVYEESDA